MMKRFFSTSKKIIYNFNFKTINIQNNIYIKKCYKKDNKTNNTNHVNTNITVEENRKIHNIIKTRFNTRITLTLPSAPQLKLHPLHYSYLPLQLSFFLH